jgi:hypothetical protein
MKTHLHLYRRRRRKKTPIKVALVEDKPDVRDSRTRRSVLCRNLRICTCSSGEEALR